MEIHDSFQRILEAEDQLGVMFYQHFLAEYPEVQRHFERVDLKRQSILLVTALMIIGRHATNATPATELYLQYLGTRHKDMQIPKDIYPAWIKAMLETMRRFHGQDWSPELEDQWREAFERAVEIMYRGYDHRVTV